MDFHLIFDRLFKMQSTYNEDNKTLINNTEEGNTSTLLSVVSSCHRFFMSTKFAHDTEMQLQVYQLSTYWVNFILHCFIRSNSMSSIFRLGLVFYTIPKCSLDEVVQEPGFVTINLLIYRENSYFQHL